MTCILPSGSIISSRFIRVLENREMPEFTNRYLPRPSSTIIGHANVFHHDRPAFSVSCNRWISLNNAIDVYVCRSRHLLPPAPVLIDLHSQLASSYLTTIITIQLFSFISAFLKFTNFSGPCIFYSVLESQ